MKKRDSLVLNVSSSNDLNKIKKGTKYINIDITNLDYDVLKYFLKYGEEYMYSDICEGIPGYNYVTHSEFVKGEEIIDKIYMNMPSGLTELELCKYLYISLGKYVSVDINMDASKNELCNISMLNNIDNIWGSLFLGKVNDNIITKIYYYLCKRVGIDIKILNKENVINIDNKIFNVVLYNDLPFIQTKMKTRYFGPYNDDVSIDKKIKYIKDKYTDYYLDRALKNIDYTSDDAVWYILDKTKKIIGVDNVRPNELKVIYDYIFKTYSPNTSIKINDLFLNKSDKLHFIMISYNSNHYSYNYRKKAFIKVSNDDILDNINANKIGLYLHEVIPNIDNY